ncbi:hypothetical protein LIA77_02575 [Sarocladium implicatum]|nr:hypothetical protein LIA77_02575 [Sarocladium implicatum]
MLTSVARTALRRVLARTPATTSSAATRALPIRSLLQLRSFNSSEPVSQEAAAAAPKPRAARGDKKSTTAKKAPAKKAAAKKKVAAKKPAKKKAVKKVAVKKPKKVLTQEEKDAAKLKEWKKLALLKEPKGEPSNAWLLYVARNQKSRPGTDAQKEVARGYHDLSATEMSDLQAEADANKTANKNLMLQWIESHTPERIALANEARSALSKAGKKRSPIEDHRLPRSHIRSGFNFYLADALEGRARDQQMFTEVAKNWSSMSQEEKRPFNEMAEAEKTLVTRQREELSEKVKVLKKELKQEAKTAATPARAPRKTKATTTNELGL